MGYVNILLTDKHFSTRKQFLRQATRTTVFHSIGKAKHTFNQVQHKLIQLWISPDLTISNHCTRLQGTRETQ